MSKTTDFRPGDFIAINCPDRSNNIGRITFVDSGPEWIESTAPVDSGTLKGYITLIDSCQWPDGATDSGLGNEGGGRDYGGLGVGTMHL